MNGPFYYGSLVDKNFHQYPSPTDTELTSKISPTPNRSSPFCQRIALSVMPVSLNSIFFSAFAWWICLPLNWVAFLRYGAIHILYKAWLLDANQALQE